MIENSMFNEKKKVISFNYNINQNINLSDSFHQSYLTS